MATKATCFLDIDGTLAMTDGLYLKAFQDLMAEHGTTSGVDAAWFATHVAGKVDADVFRAILPGGASIDDAAVRALSAKKDVLYCERLRSDGAELVPGLGESFLPMCAAEGIRCIAVSNAQRGGCEAVLGQIKARIPLAESIIGDLIVGAECARAKPFPDPYLEALRRVGQPPARCVVFEDSRTGVKAGVAAGLKVVGLTTSMTAADMLAAGATTTVADWTEVTADFLADLVRA